LDLLTLPLPTIFYATAIDLIQTEKRVAAHRVGTLFFVSGTIVKFDGFLSFTAVVND
jgi:hypothetical protein